jgi:hypothetical protein
MVLYILKEAEVEGIKEVVSTVSESVTDYMIGAIDKFMPFKGIPESFIYGAVGGI